MAHSFRLGEAGQIERRSATETAELVGAAFGVGQIDARAGGVASFENQTLGLQQAAIAGDGFGFHCSTPRTRVSSKARFRSSKFFSISPSVRPSPGKPIRPDLKSSLA